MSSLDEIVGPQLEQLLQSGPPEIQEKQEPVKKLKK